MLQGRVYATRLLISLVAMVTASPALALDVELYAEMLEQHTVAVADIASTRVDYKALRDAASWKGLVESPALDPSPVIPSDLSFGYLSTELKSPVKIPIPDPSRAVSNTSGGWQRST